MTAIAAACAMLPDIDAVGLRLGIPYGAFLGHRGFTHSIVFAGIAALAVTFLFWKNGNPVARLQVLVCVFAATISHGLLDAFTNGGMGIAFLSPFVETRYFFPITPIRVSPIGIKASFTHKGISVLVSELIWVWCPSIILGASARFARCKRAS